MDNLYWMKDQINSKERVQIEKKESIIEAFFTSLVFIILMVFIFFI